MLRVDAIHRGEVTHVRQKHTGAHNIIEILASRLENRREILEDALRLGHNAPLDHLASRRVLADMTADVEETIASIAWENGPTGGVSSGEVIAVLLMANSCGYWVGWYGTYAAKNQR